MIRAYHFVGSSLRDGRPIPPDGEWLVHDGPLVLCESGLHASPHPSDALTYAPGETLCLVDCDGDVIEGDDKLVCSRRRIVARIDATAILRAHARWCALQVVHLWDAPDVERRYLETGDEALRAAAAAAGTTAWAAERAARAAAAAAQRDDLRSRVEAAFTAAGVKP